MAGRDFNNLGQDLNRIIEEAIYMGNFRHLNDTINRTVRGAFQSFDSRPGQYSNGNFSDGAFTGGGDWEFNLSGEKPGGADRTQAQSNSRDSFAGQAGYAGQAGTGTWAGRARQAGTGAQAGAAGTDLSRKQSAYFAGRGKRRGGAIGMIAGGVILLVLSIIPLALSAFGALISLQGTGSAFLGAFGVFAVSGAALTAAGSKGMKLAGKFDQYVRHLNGKTYEDIKTLATYTHQTETAVVKDIKKMLKKGWFLQGHLDHQEKCLMVSNEAYAQYMKALEGAKMQKVEAEKRRVEESRRGAGLSPEAKAIIDKGQEYIKQIRASNDAIPGEEVSEKIDRMELLVKKIFQQAEEHPENVSDLRKLMEYYLPMTMKLLKAYEEMDQQIVQGDNIVNSKKEIEMTLDTLNIAFEKLLDNLFQDRAWDVSADISVLQTMLAQEGLTEDGLTGKRG